MDRLLWNPRGPNITLGEKAVNITATQARLMGLIGARPGAMVSYQTLGRDGTTWYLEAYRRLRKRLIGAFGQEATDKALVNLHGQGLRWDGASLTEAKVAPLLVKDKNGKPMSMARAIRGAEPDGFLLRFDGMCAGVRHVLLMRVDGQFIFLSTTPEGLAYVLLAGTGVLTR